MKNLLGTLARVYAAVSAYVLALLVIIVAVLVAGGALRPERVREALAVLRRPAGADPVPAPADAARTEGERQLDRKAEELRRLEDRVAGMIAQARGEQEALERRRADAVAAEASARKSLDELGAATADAELAANLPMLGRMDGAGIVDLMKDWDDPRIVRYLRAMRPGKAAEVIEAIQTDPRFEEGFRKVPSGAPPGTKSRAERLNQALTRVQ